VLKNGSTMQPNHCQDVLPPFFESRARKSSLKPLLNRGEYPSYEQLQPVIVLLFRATFLFLTEGKSACFDPAYKYDRIRRLLWLLRRRLVRRYRADTFGHFQTAVLPGALMASRWKPMDDYKEYRLQIQRRREHQWTIGCRPTTCSQVHPGRRV